MSLYGVMSSIVKEAIVQEVGDSWFTLQVYGIRDPTGVENISIVLCFFNEDTKVVTKRLLALATSSSCDAQALTEVIFSKLDAAGLATTKISSQVNNESGSDFRQTWRSSTTATGEGMQEIPYVHCLNHQLHTVVLHTLSEKQAVQAKPCERLFPHKSRWGPLISANI